MSISRRTLEGNIGESIFEAEIGCKADIYFDYYDIQWVKADTPKRPFDYVVTVGRKQPNGKITDQKKFRVQVKTTLITDNNEIKFATCHDGKRYTPEEIDIFFLCYRNPRDNKKFWYGLAFTSECKTYIKFAYGKKPTGTNHDTLNFDFDARFEPVFIVPVDTESVNRIVLPTREDLHLPDAIDISLATLLRCPSSSVGRTTAS